MNKAQYDLICLLTGNFDNLFVVGDDDQSIYRWRGADPSIIMNFPKNFKGGQIYSDLDECWRCAEHILQGALGLVSHNRNRCHKTLHSKCGEGSLINVLHSPSAEREAKVIADWIVKKCSNGSFRPRDIAIFYPIKGMQNKVIEELESRGVEVECRGGGGMFGDEDIRKILAHIRILDNPNDNLALRKCLDTPMCQGIGEEGKRSLRRIAQRVQQPLWDILTHAHSYGELEKWQKSFGRFVSQVNDLREKSKELKIDELVQLLADKIGATSNNVDELKNLAKLLPEGSNLQDFLRVIRDRRLDVTEGDIGVKEEKDAVKIFTIHLAKGLEFKVVFLLGMEEDIFPNPKYNTIEQIEEQRRLCYVAMTRARMELFMCHVTMRKGPPIRGSIRLNGRPSPFISEIPQEHVRRLKAPL
jgi:DNA helicase-2/ATP-dependent DNA helicase PcrA